MSPKHKGRSVKKTKKNIKVNKFGNGLGGVQESGCCKNINVLVSEIDSQLNKLVNMRKGLFPDDSDEMKIFYKKIDEMKSLLSGLDTKDFLIKEQGDVIPYLKNVKDALRMNPVDYESVYTGIVTAAKNVSGVDVSDKFPSTQKRDNQKDRGALLRQVDAIANSNNKYDELISLYKTIFNTDAGLYGT